MSWLINLTSLVCNVGQYLSGRVSALHYVIVGLISSGGDHGIYGWWSLIRSKQLSIRPVCRVQYLLFCICWWCYVTVMSCTVYIDGVTSQSWAAPYILMVLRHSYMWLCLRHSYLPCIIYTKTKKSGRR